MLQILTKTFGVIKYNEELCSIRKFSNCINRTNSLLQGRLFSTTSENVVDKPVGGNSTQNIDVKALTNGDEKLEHKMQVIMLEAEVLRQEGRKVPSNDFLKQHHWQELLNSSSSSFRRKYFEYLFKIEKTKENEALKKAEKKRLYEQRLAEKPADNDGDKDLKYELGKNSIFLRVRDTTMNQLYNNYLVQAMQFGQKLIVDCGYFNDMTSRENINCAKQLTLLFAENREHKDPFDLHFCNVNYEHVLMKALHKNIPIMYEDWFPLNLHQGSYLDNFDREQLVYLTPHCQKELDTYDHDAIYIIGAIVDKINQAPLSLAKAKKENLKMAKLPLDRYLQWGSGSGKSLTLNQVASILLDVKYTGDWTYALRHVPKRKIVSPNLGNNIESYSSLPYDKNTVKHGKLWRPRSSQSRDKPKSYRNINETLLNMKEIMKE